MSKLTVVSHSYPSTNISYNATFVEDHCIALSEVFDINLIVPTPLSLPFTKRYNNNTAPLLLSDTFWGKRSFYLSFPNKIFPDLIKFSLSQSLISSLRVESPDLIHIHFLYPSGLSITSIKKNFNLPVVLTLHGVDFYHTRNNDHLASITDKQLLSADKIIVVGPKLLQDVLTVLPEIKPKLKMVYNYIDTGYFTPPSDIEKKQGKEILKLDDGYFHLLCVANLRYKKGIDVLLNAVLQLSSNFKFKIHLIGRLDDEADYVQSIKEFINKKLENTVIIHGPKNRSEIRDWLRSVDGFVLPSRNEPFGISLIEAMACGLPVISTKSGGPESIISKELGQLIEPDNVTQLSEALIKMVTGVAPNPDIMNHYIKKNFGKQTYLEKYTDIYNQLLNSNL